MNSEKSIDIDIHEEETNGKILMVFDMHKTIISRAADYELIGLLPEKIVREELPEPYGYEHDWIDYMQKVYMRLAKENISIKDLKEHVQRIPINEGFQDIFSMLRSEKNKLDSLIISGSNRLIIRWILEHNKIDDVFPNYYSNLAAVDDICGIKIKHYHFHSCPNCDKSLCKRILLKEHLTKLQSKYKKIVYVGDGDNDYCPSTILTKNDLLFPRCSYSLHKKLLIPKYRNNLKCGVHLWNTGRDISKIIKKLI